MRKRKFDNQPKKFIRKF